MLQPKLFRFVQPLFLANTLYSGQYPGEHHMRPLQYLHKLPVVQKPKLYTVLKMWPNQRFIRCKVTCQLLYSIHRPMKADMPNVAFTTIHFQCYFRESMGLHSKIHLYTNNPKTHLLHTFLLHLTS